MASRGHRDVGVRTQCGAQASERPKRLREDSLMLVRGLVSVAASLAQLSDTLTAAQKGVNALATCSSSHAREEEPDAKRCCGGASATEFAATLLHAGIDDAGEASAAGDAQPRDDAGGDARASAEVAQSTNLKRARNLAVSMAGRAANLARELKTIKSELHFMQERCGLLEEENKRLRDGYDNGGAAHEEDDLVRLQLAQDNANLARENQSLIQLVEYHQLTSQEDLAASYEDVMEGMCLDFSTPMSKIDDEEDERSSTPTEFPSPRATSSECWARLMSRRICGRISLGWVWLVPMVEFLQSARCELYCCFLLRVLCSSLSTLQ